MFYIGIFKKTSIRANNDKLNEYECLGKNYLLVSIENNPFDDDVFTIVVVNIRSLSKHWKDVSKDCRLFENEFLGFTESQLKPSELQTDLQKTLEPLNMHFYNNEDKSWNLAYSSQKSISNTQKINY